MKKILRITMLAILITVIAFSVGVTLFINLAPQFGQTPEGNTLKRISSSKNYKDGEFKNLIETTMDMGFGNILITLKEFMTAKNTVPEKALPVKFEAIASMVTLDSSVYITWIVHSAILLEIEGKRILIDPMFGPTAGPVSFFSRRFPNEKPIDLTTFKNVDAVIISHDHYDHLDHGSIVTLKDNVKYFFVPLGVGSHLQRWGVDSASITELDWWESAQLDQLTFTAAPARHFSGRAITDRNKTLWASWVLTGTHHNIYFSGDGGYGPHFKEIGSTYGPLERLTILC